jgi:hypothetical protein
MQDGGMFRMPGNIMKKLKANEKNLSRRYLLWCYKTTKEALDRVDRYYTQLEIDQIVLKDLKKSKGFKTDQAVKKLILDFENYMERKRINVNEKKFLDVSSGKLSPEYEYLKLRFAAIQKAIVYFLGDKELSHICKQYEEEMTQRILASRENT